MYYSNFFLIFDISTLKYLKIYLIYLKKKQFKKHFKKQIQSQKQAFPTT